MIRIAQLKTL